jgi:hypothetical protein
MGDFPSFSVFPLRPVFQERMKRAERGILYSVGHSNDHQLPQKDSAPKEPFVKQAHSLCCE